MTSHRQRNATRCWPARADEPWRRWALTAKELRVNEKAKRWQAGRQARDAKRSRCGAMLARRVNEPWQNWAGIGTGWRIGMRRYGERPKAASQAEILQRDVGP